MEFVIKLPHNPVRDPSLDDMDFEDLEFLYIKRKFGMLRATRFFKDIPREKAYETYCEQTKQDYIGPALGREYQRLKKIHVTDEKARRYKCKVCDVGEVTLSALCPSCAEFKRGLRVSIYCNKCGTTTFSADDIAVVRSGYTEIEHG